MLDAIIFDIGNVLISYDYERCLKRILAHCDAPAAKIAAEAIPPLKQEYECGQISDDEFVTRAIALLGYRGPRPEFVAAWQECFDPIHATHELVDALRERYPLFLLSNTNGLHAEYFLSAYPVFSKFKAAVYSHCVQMMKPEAEIYEQAIVEFGVNPGRTLFIDDLPDNVEAARGVGMLAHQYARDRHEDLLALLRKLGVAV